MAPSAALSLLETRKATGGKAGGIHTPATALGENLEKRLDMFGIDFKIENNLSMPSSSCFFHY
jgi:short subunit dehydrogenase-like uncharacterized protein